MKEEGREGGKEGLVGEDGWWVGWIEIFMRIWRGRRSVGDDGWGVGMDEVCGGYGWVCVWLAFGNFFFLSLGGGYGGPLLAIVSHS